MDLWMQVGTKFSNVENDLHSVSQQLALLQDFIRVKFQAEFKAFVEATATEVAECTVFGSGDTEAAATGSTASTTSTAQGEMYHRQRNEDSSLKTGFIASSVSGRGRRLRAAPSSTSKPMSSSVSVVSTSGNVLEPYYQSEEIIGEHVVEQTLYNTNSGGFEAEEAHEFLPTVLEPPEIIDEKFEPPEDAIGLDDDGSETEYPLGLGTSTLSQGSSGGEQLKSRTRHTAERITSIPSRYVEETVPRGRRAKGSPRLRTECWKCHKTFNNATHLRRHEMTHLTVKPFKCLHCPTRFTRKDHMKAHMDKYHEGLAHVAIKPLTCLHCPTRFTRKDLMKAHINKFHKGLQNCSSDEADVLT